jgi:SAM-dependent methyltransferase
MRLLGMRIEEAAWIGERLAKLDIRTVLELGSSTRSFRTQTHPHHDRLIHAPLRAKGIRIILSDLQPDVDIDIAGDIYDDGVQARLRQAGADAVLCCNMFEHVVDRDRLASICHEVLRPGGYLVVSVPFSYPYHTDPIDTYFRPTPAEIAAMFPTYTLVDSAVIASRSFGQEMAASSGVLPKEVVRRAYCLCKVWLPRSQYVELNHRLLWLFRPYRISCVVLRRPLVRPERRRAGFLRESAPALQDAAR